MPQTSPWELVYFLFILVGVVFLAYFVSKWLSKKYASNGQATKHLKVVDRLVLGQDRALYIVKVGEKAMLLGVTQHSIEKLDDIAIEDLPEKMQSQSGGSSFADTLKTTLKNNWGIKVGKTDLKSPDDGEGKKDIDDK